MTDQHSLDLSHKFLIAMPSLADTLFSRAVVLICYHDAQGAMGLVINKPKGQLTLSDMLPEIGIEGEIRVANSHVVDGGPVDIDRGFVLHSDDITLKSQAAPLRHGLCLSSTRDALESLVSDQPPAKALLAIGYAGWDGGQLEREIQDNAWIIAESDPDIIFSQNHSAKWDRALRSLGIAPKHLSSVSGRA
jgi:putative transcriptional regulator